MNGFLSPRGEYYDSNHIMHMETALKLVKLIYNVELKDGVEAEKYLLSHNWIIIRGNDIWSYVGKPIDNYKNLCYHLTKYQINFLNNIYDKVNKSCQMAIDLTFKKN